MIPHRCRRWIASALIVSATAGTSLGDGQLVESVVQEAVEEQIRQRVEASLEALLDDRLANDVLDGVDATVAAALAKVDEIVPYPEPFQPAIVDDGYTVEAGVWVILATPEDVRRIDRRGYRVLERRRLEGLGRVLMRVEAPADRELAEAALELQVEAPGARIDHNHVYRPQAAGPADGPRTREAKGRRGPAITVGIVDSMVETKHEALSGARIEGRDFVPFQASRPADHGTAVASILVGDAPEVRGLVPGARLYAASVFFVDEGGGSAAAASSLVQALDWLVASGVGVVNMSLAGPPNRVLEAAVAQVVQRGAVVVAAVGNAGPAGEPLYPAAYEAVVGVTAVDAGDRPYRYANRGRQVSFAALGVDVPVALPSGGYGADSGTSMAAPAVSAALAARLARGNERPARALATLKREARDLGDTGYDETFGHGLVPPPD